MITTIIILSILDVTLTHYTLFLDKKKDVLDMMRERSWLPRLIMNGNPNPRNYIIGNIVSSGLLFMIINLVNIYFNEYYFEILWSLFGLYVMLLYIHILNIVDAINMWDNKKFWKIIKKLRGLRNEMSAL